MKAVHYLNYVPGKLLIRNGLHWNPCSGTNQPPYIKKNFFSEVGTLWVHYFCFFGDYPERPFTTIYRENRFCFRSVALRQVSRSVSIDHVTRCASGDGVTSSSDVVGSATKRAAEKWVSETRCTIIASRPVRRDAAARTVAGADVKEDSWTGNANCIQTSLIGPFEDAVLQNSQRRSAFQLGPTSANERGTTLKTHTWSKTTAPTFRAENRSRLSKSLSIFIHQHIGRTCIYKKSISWKTNTE